MVDFRPGQLGNGAACAVEHDASVFTSNQVLVFNLGFYAVIPFLAGAMGGDYGLDAAAEDVAHEGGGGGQEEREDGERRKGGYHGSMPPPSGATAAQVIATAPTFVRVRFRSVRIRARTGNAVMLIAAPMNSATDVKRISGVEVKTCG